MINLTFSSPFPQLLEEYFEKLIAKELPECVGDLKDPKAGDEVEGSKKAKLL